MIIARSEWRRGAVAAGLVLALAADGAAAQSGISNERLGNVIGGVGGAVLGSQIGGGSGRVVGGVIGALGGAVIGGAIGRSMDAPPPRPAPAQTVYPAATPSDFYGAAPPALEPAAGEIRVARVRSNVRSGPGAQHPIVARLEQGEEVTVLGASGDGGWYLITRDGRGRGYVSAPLLVAPPARGDGYEG